MMTLQTDCNIRIVNIAIFVITILAAFYNQILISKFLHPNLVFLVLLYALAEKCQTFSKKILIVCTKYSIYVWF